MTYSKTKKFNSEFQELAKICKVLSHPARIAILKHLADCETCISGDISKEIPLSRTTVSQHLQELKKAGFIQGEIDGVKINYCICHDEVKKYKNLISKYFQEISLSKNFIKCC